MASGKAPSEMPAFQPYRGKPAVRNDRGDGGNVDIIRSPLRATVLPDCGGRSVTILPTATLRASHGCSHSPCLPYHFYQNFSGFPRTTHLPQECDAGTTRAILGFQAYVKEETVDRSHRHFLRLDSSKCPGKQDERIRVIGIHVLDDVGCSVSQRVGLPTVIFRGRDPAHHPEATYVVNVHHVHPVKGKVVKVHPVFAVGITRQVEFPCFSHLRHRYRQSIS